MYSEVEKKASQRIKTVTEKNREFFRISEEEVINFLELVPGKM